MRILLAILVLAPLLTMSQKIYLIGDAGEPKSPDKNLLLLTEKFSTATSDDVLIFLGDNLYPRGLPDKEDADRVEMEVKLVAQLEVMKKFPGKKFMIPGNHDWAQGRKYGWKRIRNMSRFVSQYLGDKEVFLPSGGCPGPVEVPLGPSSTLVLFDTQYFLHGWDKPDFDDFCDNKSALETLEELYLIINRNKGRHIIIAAHHPMYTYGPHHGNFSFTSQLTPLPILGSIMPLYRRTIGNIQDNTNPKYKLIMSQIRKAMDQADHVIYTSGHEHSLQLIEKGKHHYIVSGSGSKTSYTKMGKDSRFARKEQGFAVVDLQESGEASVQFWGVDNGMLFEGDLYQKQIIRPDTKLARPNFSDSTVVVRASEKYMTTRGGQRWLGRNYRDIWATQVEVPVFDLKNEYGGLEVLKKGGGMQTKSLRMEAEDGKQYVLRSIEKYPENAIPDALKKTFAQDIVQDQISASHPYGAFIVPPLADAANIYHTNPKPVYIPDDPLLGQYRETFASTLALYEERPNKKAAHLPYFGSGEDIEGTDDVIDILREDNDNVVDQNFVARNRIFDLWIGDWDRHDDQWRWVEFDKDKGKGKVYRPIPRDRDQAFFINEGFIPSIASRKWALPKIEGFDERIRWAPGLSQNARFFDRTFMNEPDWEDWQAEIRFLQAQLTDEVIHDAVALWPEDIQKLSGERIIRGLKARRADMPRYARELYLYLSDEVEVLGSDKHEHFFVERLSEKEIRVTVHKRKKEGDIEQIMYQRVFKADETKEIRLYGLDGEDVFELSGVRNSKIRVRIIGGTDKDRIINKEGDQRLSKVKVYDRKKSTELEGNTKGMSMLSSDPSINRYDRKSFQYDVLMPLVAVGLNPDDGLALGAGFDYTVHGWRKEPFASRHTLMGTVAFETGAYNFDYKSTFTDLLGSWDVEPSAVVQEPFFVNNYFGLGNETVFEMDRSVPPDNSPIDYYRVRIRRFEGNLDFTKEVGKKAKFYAGPGYRRIQVEETPNRFLADQNLPRETFDRNRYFKFRVGISLDTRNNPIMPLTGMTALAEIERYDALSSFSESFNRARAEWAFYLTTKLPARLTIANRVGAAHNSSPFEFFNANTLGGRSNLRSYRRTRFYGQTSFYHNIELRMKLFSFRSYIFPGQFGIIAFHDTGRVWLEGESSNKWHTGKGFGIWLSPLNTLVLNLNYGFGEDENLPAFYFGFFF